jgi:hypothetical protein
MYTYIYVYIYRAYEPPPPPPFFFIPPFLPPSLAAVRPGVGKREGKWCVGEGVGGWGGKGQVIMVQAGVLVLISKPPVPLH